jgi:hypothetical protein
MADAPANHHQTSQRRRRWHVTFGNPALGTYNGSIVTVHGKKVEHHLQEQDGTSYDMRSDESSCDSFSSCSSLDSSLPNEECREQQNPSLSKETNRTTVMTNVPPHQVPDGNCN